MPLQKKRSFTAAASKGKTAKYTSKKNRSDSDNDDDLVAPKKAKISGKSEVDDEGNTYWELGGKLRRVGVSEFKGTILVNIREYYEKDGKALPGKKGISLTLEQYNTLVSCMPQIEQVLKSKTEDEISRPAYTGDVSQKGTISKKAESEDTEDIKEEAEKEDVGEVEEEEE